MKCKKCRKQIPDGSKFCNHCGTPTKQTALYRRPDGLYEKIVNINGKRVAFRAKKEADVFRKISEYEEKQEKGPTFAEVADLWYNEHWETLSPTTQKGYNAAFTEIVEEFGGEYIKQLTHRDPTASARAHFFKWAFIFGLNAEKCTVHAAFERLSLCFSCINRYQTVALNINKSTQKIHSLKSKNLPEIIPGERFSFSSLYTSRF